MHSVDRKQYHSIRLEPSKQNATKCTYNPTAENHNQKVQSNKWPVNQGRGSVRVGWSSHSAVIHRGSVTVFADVGAFWSSCIERRNLHSAGLTCQQRPTNQIKTKYFLLRKWQIPRAWTPLSLSVRKHAFPPPVFEYAARFSRQISLGSPYWKSRMKRVLSDLSGVPFSHRGSEYQPISAQ